MKKKRMSLAVKLYLMIIAIITVVFVLSLLISNWAYRDAVFVPREVKMTETELPADELLPDLEYFQRFLGTESLREARENLKTDGQSVLHWLREQPSRRAGTEEDDGSGMLQDLARVSDVLDYYAEVMDADEICIEIDKDGVTHRVIDAVKGVALHESITGFGEEAAFSDESASAYATPALRRTAEGYELLRCTELDGGNVRIWIRADMTEAQKYVQVFIIRIIVAVLIVTVLISAVCLYLLRCTVIRPVQSLARAANNFRPEEDGTYSMEKVSQVNLQMGDEIGDLSREIRTMQEQIVENTGNLATFTAQKERIIADLELAREIQASALPAEIPDRPEFDLYASMTPSLNVGGDFYDYFLIDDDHLALVIADVSGKGIPAALFMMISISLIRNQLMSGADPAEALKRVNLQLSERNESMSFVTVWLAVLELSTGTGVTCNAGHENPVYRRAGERFELLVYKHDAMVGVSPRAEYHLRPFEMHPGDCLFVYTDGVPEANNPSREMFGTDQLQELLNEDPDAGPEELIRRVHDAVDRFADGEKQFDDITMLSLKYTGRK